MKEIRLGTFRGLPNLWSYGFSITRNYVRGEGWVISLWCFKLIKLPEHGESLQRKKHYKGINLSVGILFKLRFYKN